MVRLEWLLVVAVATGLGGGGAWAAAQSARAASSAASVVATAKAASSSQALPRHERLISSDGIGPARLGMRFGQLKAQMGRTVQFKRESPHIDGFDAVAVVQDGVVQYRILHPAGQSLRDKDTLRTLTTEHPAYQTAQGIGPGATLRHAEAVFGQVTLQYNEENESREEASFAGRPPDRVSFMPAAPGQAFAGIYRAGQAGPIFQTGRYRPNAVIRSVWVSE